MQTNNIASQNQTSGEDYPELRPIQTVILRIYDIFSEIVSRHGLRHYVSCGSALGAVRHRGFIPWDDDMDVAMPREDYMKLIDIAKVELPDGLAWVDHHNTPEFPDHFGKIQVTDRSLVDSLEKSTGYPLPHGIFLDVFALDGYPTNPLKILRRRFLWKMLRARNFYFWGRKPSSLREHIVWWIGRFSGVFFDHYDTFEDRFRIEESIALSVPPFQSRYCCNFQSGYSELVFFFPSRCWEPCSQGVFEGRTVPLPGDCDTLLRMQYGDYMKLPPLEQRQPRHESIQPAPWKYGPTRTGKGTA